MSQLKYSDYVRIIADEISEENKYICIVITWHPLNREYPEYAEKLRNTIKTKIAKSPKERDGTVPTTLFSAYLEYLKSEMKVDQVTWRKQWLESIARIHERKGN